MTERFMVDDCGTLIDLHTRDTFDYVSDVCDLLNELYEEKEHLKTRFHEERELAMRLGSECDNLTIKNQKLELEIIRLEMIIKTGDNNDCNRTS